MYKRCCFGIEKTVADGEVEIETRRHSYLRHGAQLSGGVVDHYNGNHAMAAQHAWAL